MARAWAQRLADSKGAGWIRTKAAQLDALSVEGQAAFLRALPPGTELKALLEDGVTAEVVDRYWRSVNPMLFLDPEQVVFGARQLIAHGRPAGAIDLLLNQGKPALAGATVELVSDALSKAIAAEPADIGRSPTFDYEVGVLLDHLTDQGADDSLIAQFEWAYFQLLEHSRSPRALFAQLKRDPAFFVDRVSWVYRGKSERRRQLDEGATRRAQNAWSVLQAWRDLPGRREDGSIDRQHLHKWVKQARLMLAERDRADIGDEQIGQVLSGSPPGTDGAWPAEPVRELIEDIGSRELETGLHIGMTNSRGVTSRGIYDGGQQERELAARYRDWAKITASQWPRTSRVLRGLADDYERDARRMDLEAEALANRD